MDALIRGADLKNTGTKITLGGKEYELVIDFNAISDMEEKYGDLNTAFDKVQNGKMSDIKFLLAAMMRHTDDEITERMAGKLITTENMQEVFDALGKALGNSVEEKNAQNPQDI